MFVVIVTARRQDRSVVRGRVHTARSGDIVCSEETGREGGREGEGSGLLSGFSHCSVELSNRDTLK